MMGIGWRLVDVVSQLLERDEREAVQGDLIEAGQSAWQGLMDVAGLVIRRQTTLWKNWQPWLAAFGLAMPSTLLLMGFSLSVSGAFEQFIDATILKSTGLTVGPGVSLLMCRVLLLLAWSCTGTFLVGSLSRRAVWLSVALSSVASLFCFARYREESLSRLCLLLFLVPAIWGVRQGLRAARIKLQATIVLALAVTALTIPAWSSGSPWMLDWALSWPAWYIVATARRPG